MKPLHLDRLILRSASYIANVDVVDVTLKIFKNLSGVLSDFVPRPNVPTARQHEGIHQYLIGVLAEYKKWMYPIIKEDAYNIQCAVVSYLWYDLEIPEQGRTPSYKNVCGLARTVNNFIEADGLNQLTELLSSPMGTPTLEVTEEKLRHLRSCAEYLISHILYIYALSHPEEAQRFSGTSLSFLSPVMLTFPSSGLHSIDLTAYFVVYKYEQASRENLRVWQARASAIFQVLTEKELSKAFYFSIF